MSIVALPFQLGGLLDTICQMNLGTTWCMQHDTREIGIVPPMMFVLCADDFAMTDGVSRAILDLLAARRLSATGAMTNRPGWSGWARELAPHGVHADLGVHLNLTCASPLGTMPGLCPDGTLPALGTVIRAALVSARSRRELSGEIARQLDAFEQAMGRVPDFIDGHQHVHAMPGVRELVLAEMARRYITQRPYVRDPADSMAAIRARGVAVGKALVISGLAAGFGKAARALGFATNGGFAGVSPFDPARDFAADMARFLVRPGTRHLVMCHPGFVDDALLALDPVVGTRPLEHAALMGGCIPKDAQMVRFSAMNLVS